MAIGKMVLVSAPRRKKAARRTSRMTWNPKSFRNRALVTRPNGLYNYIQTVPGSNISGMASRTIVQLAVASNYSFEFALSQLPQSATFTALYDQYRINSITVVITPMLNVASTTDNASGLVAVANSGMIATVVDYDGGSALTTIDNYMEYQNCKIQPCISTRPVIRTFRPRTNVSIQNIGGGVGSADNKGGRWLDCGLNNVVHYGLRVYVDAYAGLYNYQHFDVYAKYNVSFRNVR